MKAATQTVLPQCVRRARRGAAPGRRGPGPGPGAGIAPGGARAFSIVGITAAQYHTMVHGPAVRISTTVWYSGEPLKWFYDTG